MAISIIAGPVINANQSLSNAVNVTSGGIFRLIMPPAWDKADITLQLSYDGVGFYNAYDKSGNEIVVPCIAGSIVALDDYSKYVHSLKIRSGTFRTPVAQTQSRSFTLVLDTKAVPAAEAPSPQDDSSESE